jgi:hypothetical protein
VISDKVERNCHFPATGWNCKTRRQALQGFPDTSQASLQKNNKINLAVPAGSREVAPAFIFTSERTVFLPVCLSVILRA